MRLYTGGKHVPEACQLARATTHTDLQLRARSLGIEVRVVHNASIITAVGVCGLQLYRYGEVPCPRFSAVLIDKINSSAFWLN